MTSETPIFDQLFEEWKERTLAPSTSLTPAPRTAMTTPRPGQKPIRKKKNT